MAFLTSREIAADPACVFAAFEDAARLASWWGPAGFTNTFEVCEFKPGGQWVYTMYGPDGRAYPNEMAVREIEPGKRIVLWHVSKPHYLLTVTLEPTGSGGTLVRWDHEFENPRVAEGIAHIVEQGNEENLDRLSAEVLRTRGN